MKALYVISAGALLLPLMAPAQARPPAAATAAALTPASAAALLERTARLYTHSRGLRAEFTQRVKNPITSSETASAGSYLQRGPGVFSVNFVQPAGDRIVSDGRTLWVYVPSATPGQVLKMPVGAGAPGGVDLVGQFFTSPSRKFNTSDGGLTTLGTLSLRKLVLVPKSDMGFTRAVLWVIPATGALKQLEVTENSGLVRTLAFSSFTMLGAMPADAFTFVVPRGITVVDQAAMLRGM
jgi:outer membrane lipoprotein carrier protein